MSIDRLTEAFQAAQDAGAKGRTRDAALALAAGVNALPAPERRAWVYRRVGALARERHGRIRHELFERAMFPVLRQEFEAGRPDAAKALGICYLNLGPFKSFLKQMNWPGPVQFFEIAHAADPTDPEARELLAGALADALAGATHRWDHLLDIGSNPFSETELREFEACAARIEDLDEVGTCRSYLDFVQSCLARFRAL